MTKTVYHRGMGVPSRIPTRQEHVFVRGPSPMASAASSGTNQHLTLDDPSFERLLEAAWVLQCLHDQLHPPVVSDEIVESVVSQDRIETVSLDLSGTIDLVVQPPAMVTMANSQTSLVSARSADHETAAELVKTQEAIETGMLDLDATVRRLVSLSPNLASKLTSVEPAQVQPAQAKVTPVELTPVELAPVELTRVEFTPSLPALSPAVTPTAKPSTVRQKPPDNKKPESHASSLSLEATRTRLRDAVTRYRATFCDNSSLRSLRALVVATPVNLQSTLKRLRGSYVEPALRRSSLNLGADLKRLQNIVTHYESRFRVTFTLRSLRAVAIATPVWLLAVIANLLLLETWLHEPFHGVQTPSPSTAEAAVTTNPPKPIVSTGAASQTAKRIESTESRRPAPFRSLASSHEQITDLATSSVIEQLSRYEMNGLLRQAKYGDDSAAFTLGMAYEVGRYVRQNCVEAARWVKTAAEAGNAAAQYNLGLRYRDGDGVSADLHESEKWLRQAAAHRNPEAKLALQLLASR
ncbi:MAG: tetratricopeptide repeat protein [Terriglobales bacterium]